MLITTSEMVQASIGFVGAVICLLSICVIVFNKVHKSSMWHFICLFITGFLLSISEVLYYIFCGNTDVYAIYITRISNFITFAANILIVFVFALYVYGLFKSTSVKPKKIYLRIIEVLLSIASIMLIVNMFTGFIYYFDENNYYARRPFYYFYCAFIYLAGLLILIISLKYKKILGLKMTLVNISFIIVPALTIIVQIFLTKISIYNFVILLCLIAILLMYFREWYLTEENYQVTSKTKNSIRFITLFLIMIMSMCASMIACLYSFELMTKKNIEKDSIKDAEVISYDIIKIIDRAYIVSYGMANNPTVIRGLQNDNSLETEKEITHYLEHLVNSFNYNQAFITSDITKITYMHLGTQKLEDTEDKGKWYNDFINSDKIADIYIANDMATNKLTMFFNVKVYNHEKKILGVAGIGINYDSLLQIIQTNENDYNATMEFINKDGYILLPSKGNDTKYPNTDLLNQATNEFSFLRNGSEAALVKYYASIDLYASIVLHNIDNNNYAALVIPSAIIFVGGIIILAGALIVFIKRENKTFRQIVESKKNSLTDKMTNLLNRSAYETDIVSLNNEKDKYIVVVIDINGLKRVNDSLGHEAGDELIITLSKYMKEEFNYSRCYRIGGDEFVILYEGTKDNLEKSIKYLKKKCDNNHGKYVNEISFSYGCVTAKDKLDLNLIGIVRKADELMYKDKYDYYSNRGELSKWN